MTKYKVNFKFKDTSKSLNELINEVLKMELQKKLNVMFQYFNISLALNPIYYSQDKGSCNSES